MKSKGNGSLRGVRVTGVLLYVHFQKYRFDKKKGKNKKNTQRRPTISNKNKNKRKKERKKQQKNSSTQGLEGVCHSITVLRHWDPLGRSIPPEGPIVYYVPRGGGVQKVWCIYTSPPKITIYENYTPPGNNKF